MDGHQNGAQVQRFFVLPRESGADEFGGSPFGPSSVEGADGKCGAVDTILSVAESAKVVSRQDDIGVALVETSLADARSITEKTGIPLYPVLRYRLAVAASSWSSALSAASPLVSSGPPKTLKMRVVDPAGSPLSNVTIHVAGVSSAGQIENAVTDANGAAELSVAGSHVAALVLEPQYGSWSRYMANFSVPSTTLEITLDHIEPTYPDARLHHCRPAQGQAGEGVLVAIVDTGVAQHADLPDARVTGVDLLQNSVQSNARVDTHGHGTHVAGVIGASGKMLGLAPKATLLSYRVFPTGSAEAENYDIASAILRATEDGADIINLSLGQPDTDFGIQDALDRAESRGVLVIAATGNDQQATKVNYPAAYDKVVGVSAFGRDKTYPADSAHALRPKRAQGTDSADFVPAFANAGKGVDCIAPGVAVVSTYLAESYQALDGTSMAAPTVSGIAATLLSNTPKLLAASRDAARAQALRALLYSKCKALGFGLAEEGSGLPR